MYEHARNKGKNEFCTKHLMGNIDLHDEINGCSGGLVEVNIVTNVHLQFSMACEDCMEWNVNNMVSRTFY